MIGVATLPNQKKGVSSVIPIDMAKEALVNKAGSEKKGAMLRGQIDAAEEYAKKLNQEMSSGKKIEGTKAQLDAAAKKKGLTYDAYKTQLENAGYTVIVK
jgi:hypothetical protein